MQILEIDGWCPPSVNLLLKSHWGAANRMKRAVKNRIWAEALAAKPRLTAATGRRRVGVEVTVSGRSGMPDGDNILKALLDALKANGLILDDSARWCELGEVAVRRGPRKGTKITLEDI